MTDIDYWFSLGSTYNFLTAMRIADVEQKTGLRFRWRPFNMFKILREMKHVPFSDKPAKAAYMWRDIERRAAIYGLAPKVPAPYVAKQVPLGTQVAFLGMREGWGPDFVRSSYDRWFNRGEEPYVDSSLADTLGKLGKDPARVIAAATGEENNRLLDEETELAKSLGIFGAPTFAIGKELFWGDDRLEDAVAWHRHGTLRP